METASRESFQELANLLRERLDVIADTGLRDADPEAHLEKLKSVSESIFAWHAKLKDLISPRLEHFLAGCSYDKALAFIENELAS